MSSLPPSPVKVTTQGETRAVRQAQDEQCRLEGLAPFQRLQASLPWWQKHAPQFVLQLIQRGVEPNFQGQHLQLKHQTKSAQEVALAMEVMTEYVQVGAAKEVSLVGTQYLVPWFVITKKEGVRVKHRLISDCREINQSLSPPKFKLDHWKDIFPVLEPKMWAIKVDLQNAYFHLSLSRALKKYVRMRIGEKVFQMEGACFGLSTLPYLWMEVMGVFTKKWRKQGLLVFVYLDDILLLAKTKTAAERGQKVLLEDLHASGMVINLKKSVLHPVQEVEHLGFTINFQEAVLKVPHQKLKSVQKELGKFLVLEKMSCRKAAAILGQLRSFLTALPCLRAFSDLLVQFTDRHRWLGWDKKLEIPSQVKAQVSEIGTLLKEWKGRSFQGKCAVRKIFSDSSTQGWGAVDVTSGKNLHEFWRSEMGLHINIKELKASIAACQSLARGGKPFF